jgi:hypothetical protein
MFKAVSNSSADATLWELSGMESRFMSAVLGPLSEQRNTTRLLETLTSRARVACMYMHELSVSSSPRCV